MIARMKLEPHMRGLPIGNVSIPGPSGMPIIVGISLTRAGGLAIAVPTADGGRRAGVDRGRRGLIGGTLPIKVIGENLNQRPR